MAGSVASLNAAMKYVMPNDKPVSLLPDNVKMYKMLPEIRETQKLGRKALVPVELTAEGGVTYGDGTAFAYETVVDGTWSEAQVDTVPVVLNMELSRGAVDRLSADKNAFIDIMTLRTRSMGKELARRAESGIFYGKSPSGLATITGAPVLSTTAVTNDTVTVTVTTGQWAPGVWAGRKGHRFEFRTSAGVAHAGTTTPLCVLKSVDWVLKKLVFQTSAGAGVTEFGTIASGDVIYFRGSYTNDMLGLDAQMLTNGSVFGIDNTVYDLWKASLYTLSSTAFSEFIKGMGVAVAVGGLADDTIAVINSTKWEALNSTVTNQNYRNTAVGDNAAAKAGVKGMTFDTQAGTTTLIGSAYVKEADGFIFSMKDVINLGVKKVSFDASNGKGEYWMELPSNYGARMQGAYEFQPMLQQPAQSVKLTVP